MTFTAPLSPPTSMTSRRDFVPFPVQPELTVAQAAKILDMSEACVDEMLDDGIIESRWENGMRLILPDSFWEFEPRYRKRRKALAELTQLAQEMGMYDD